jgi:hypothetical protein
MKTRPFFILFLFLLVPNLLRQIVYYAAAQKTGSIAFIASFETQSIFSSFTFPWLGLGEEILIGLLYTSLYFLFPFLRFLAYGWIGDALIDFLSVFSFLIFGITPLAALGFGSVLHFVLREIVLGYLCLGIPLAYFKFPLRFWSLFVSAAGSLVLLVILL